MRFDIPVMLGVAFACFPVFLTGHTISRWEGAMFLCCYVAYVAIMVMLALQS